MIIKTIRTTDQLLVNTAGLTHFSTIKGTSTNKQRARVWIESALLADYGFERGARIDIDLAADHIHIGLAEEGARKVAGRERGGRTICILDICFPVEQREEMFKGAAELEVFVKFGQLIIKAAG